MNVKEAYSNWSEQYDTNVNRTRDLEAVALKTMLAAVQPNSILEVGCGTGKNTSYLTTIAKSVLAVDLTEAMLAKAREKITDPHVQFVQADIQQDWKFTEDTFDLITFSLVLEHIEHLEPIFEKAAQKLKSGGHIYIGELHPFKQYGGTKARFESEGSTTIVDCFNHNISDFVQGAKKAGLHVDDIQEFFDSENKADIPRILAITFTKS